MSFYKEVPGRKTTLESALKFDTEPKAGSTNPVTSDGVNGAIDGAVGDASAALQQQIDDIAEKAGSGYIPKGEATVATLNGLSGQENGELYTMTDAGTLTDGSVAVFAGDTVAWDATNSVWYKAMDYAPAQYGTNEVHNLPTTITAFRTGDVIPVDGPSGTAKMGKDDLLRVTAENALGNIKNIATDATEADLVAGNYIAIDGSAGPKKLPANLVARKSDVASVLFDSTNIRSVIDKSVGLSNTDIVLGSPSIVIDSVIITASLTRAVTLKLLPTEKTTVSFSSKYKMSIRYYDNYGRFKSTGGSWVFSGDSYVVDTQYPWVRFVFADAEDDASNVNLDDLKQSVTIRSYKTSDTKLVYGGIGVMNYPALVGIGSINRVSIPNAIACEKTTVLHIPSGITALMRYFRKDGTLAGTDSVSSNTAIDINAVCPYAISFFQVSFRKDDNSDFSEADFDNLQAAISVTGNDIEIKKFITYNFDVAGSYTNPSSTTYKNTGKIPCALGDFFEFNLRYKGTFGIYLFDKNENLLESRFHKSGNAVTFHETFEINNPLVKFVLAQRMNSNHQDYVSDNYFFKKIYNPDTYTRCQILNKTSPIPTLSLRSAKMMAFSDGTAPKVDWYLVADPLTGNFYSTKNFVEKTFLFKWVDSTSFFYYSFGIRPNGDIIAVFRTETIEPASGSDDSVKRNPYVFLASEKYSIKHEVEFGVSMHPSGWLRNTGFSNLADGSCVFCEYTRPSVATANVWRIAKDADLLDPASWVITKSFTLSGHLVDGFKHCHGVNQDFYTGVVYLFTGDDDVGAQMWHSTDSGQTWTQTRTASEKYCRMINLSFTRDYVYWATDTAIYEKHFVFRCPRDVNGILDYGNIEELAQLPSTEDNLATYGTALLENLGLLVLMERCDGTGTARSMPLRVYDLNDSTLKTIGTIYSVENAAKHLGFRTDFTEFYPETNRIHCGFGVKFAESTQGNFIAMCGNIGDAEEADLNVNLVYYELLRVNNTIGFKLGTYYL